MSKTLVTAPMVSAMREFRKSGAKYSEIMKIFDISYSTAVYHCDPIQAEAQRERWRERQKKILADPVRRREYNEYQRQRSQHYRDQEAARWLKSWKDIGHGM